MNPRANTLPLSLLNPRLHKPLPEPKKNNCAAATHRKDQKTATAEAVTQASAGVEARRPQSLASPLLSQVGAWLGI